MCEHKIQVSFVIECFLFFFNEKYQQQKLKLSTQAKQKKLTFA